MKKILFVLMGIVFLFGCGNKNEKAEEDLNKSLFTFIKQNLTDLDSTMHLDSLRILKYDTITSSTILYQKINSFFDKFDKNELEYDEKSKDLIHYRQMVRLTDGLDSKLYDNSVEDYKQKLTELKELRIKDSILLKMTDSLNKVFRTSDSTTLRYFQVKCLIQYSRKDLSVKRDTIFAYLNPERKIVRREDVFPTPLEFD